MVIYSQILRYRSSWNGRHKRDAENLGKGVKKTQVKLIRYTVSFLSIPAVVLITGNSNTEYDTTTSYMSVTMLLASQFNLQLQMAS